MIFCGDVGPAAALPGTAPHLSPSGLRRPLPAVPSGLPQAAFMLDEEGVWQIMENRDKTV